MALASTTSTFVKPTIRIEERVEERWAKTVEKLEKCLTETFEELSGQISDLRDGQKELMAGQKELKSTLSIVLVVVCVLLLAVRPGDPVKAWGPCS